MPVVEKFRQKARFIRESCAVNRLTDDKFTFKHPIEEQLPFRAVVRRRGMIPDAGSEGSNAGDRVISSGRCATGSFFEVGE
jgi:hypothetical protein